MGEQTPPTHFCSIRVLVSREVSQRYVAEERLCYLLAVKCYKLLLRSVSAILVLLFLHVSGNLPSACLKTLQCEGVKVAFAAVVGAAARDCEP